MHHGTSPLLLQEGAWKVSATRVESGQLFHCQAGHSSDSVGTDNYPLFYIGFVPLSVSMCGREKPLDKGGTKDRGFWQHFFVACRFSKYTGRKGTAVDACFQAPQRHLLGHYEKLDAGLNPAGLISSETGS